jgi:hypothetical protein
VSNVTRFEQVCLEEANGDVRLALTLASRKAVAYWNAMSPGFVRERLQRPVPPAIPKKEPINAVLIEGEGK